MDVKLTLDEEMLDGVIVSALTNAITINEEQLKRLKKKKKLVPHEKEDLADCIYTLDALKRTRYYYGGEKYAC